MSFREQLKGTGVALVTPFTEDLAVDFDALGKVIDFDIENGVDYLVSLGTTGETPTLSKQEKLDIANFTFERVNGRVPVVVGIGGNSTQDVIDTVKSFPLDKAVAVLSASPYYNKPSQEGIYQHYKAIAAASPKPIILYNVPGRTGRNMEAETTIRLAAEKNIIGIKEASNNVAQVIQILRDRPQDFLVVSGDDDLVLPEMACGIDGVISVAANCFPAAFSQMVRFCLNNDFASARNLNNPLVDAYNLLFAENNPAGVKAFLFELGLIKNKLRLPVVPVSEGLHKKIKEYLKKIDD
ncbi:4-hydroxy-tetrahydrodipicolinate synthase [Ferruginibacter sp. SUN002]|uniref:4-hydroxy-tetrahydrodipicolinate synthase n=1 Tax=Ferruginibacter sp. SUN002 TaxID=2937789 RepID=UPI003D36E508